MVRKKFSCGYWGLLVHIVPTHWITCINHTCIIHIHVLFIHLLLTHAHYLHTVHCELYFTYINLINLAPFLKGTITISDRIKITNAYW